MSNHSAKIHFNDNGTPISEQFDDIYFSNTDGLKECHYVFLTHNDLPNRWQDWQNGKTFHIGETGFGTGLNFLATWSAWLTSGAAKAGIKFKYTSFEKYPLSKQDLITAHKVWPELSEFTSELAKQYPDNITQDTTLILADGQIEINIIFGDVNERIQELEFTPEQNIDAWFLDGFAPSKNPDMWTQNLFNHMARLSNASATVATFTAAGFVRRGLIEAGFVMKKNKGFGHKREMIYGTLNQTDE